MPFGIIGRTGPGMRHLVGLGDRSTGRGTFGANLGRTIVTNGEFTAYVCHSAGTRPSFQITLGRRVKNFAVDDIARSRQMNSSGTFGERQWASTLNWGVRMLSTIHTIYISTILCGKPLREWLSVPPFKPARFLDIAELARSLCHSLATCLSYAENSKNHKRWHCFAAQWHFGNVLRCNSPWSQSLIATDLANKRLT